MATALISAAFSVVRKALGLVTDPVLEAWAAAKDLGPNVEALKMELLCVRALLEPLTGREVHNAALEVLLQKLQDHAYDADDVLDELDYFRLQDQLDGSVEAVDKHPKGCAHNLVLNTRHTAKAVGKMLCLPACSSAADDVRQRTRDTISVVPQSNQADGEANGRMQMHAVGSCNPFRAVSKCFPCSSLPPVDDDDKNDAGHTGVRNTQQREHASETTKLGFDRVIISTKMKDIAEQLRAMRLNVSQILTTLGSNRSTAPNIAKSRPVTTPDIIEEKLYGRDNVINTIIHDITKGKYVGKDLTVLPIIGPGGIGKTTLTQQIYRGQKVQEHFQVKIWTCVSVNFNVNKLLEEIKEQTPKVDDEKAGSKIELIGHRLKHKRFLLILDDMWTCPNEDDWKRLLLPFRNSQEKGNIIIVTTRYPALAQMAHCVQPVQLEGVKRKEFEKLFLAYVFGDEQPRKEHICLLQTGEKIMDKLKGSPLAAKTVARLLRNNLDLDHWNRVLESKEWEFEDGEDDIMPALKLSYDYLPFHLQQCFVYCALFPQDYKFHSKELIHFWIGLDIIQPVDHRRKPEEIGAKNLQDLISLGFLKEDKTNNCYLIHDLLHDLALKVASRECLSINQSNIRSAEIQPSMRHLSISIDNADDNDGISNENFPIELGKLKMRLKNFQNLRTLMIFGKFDKGWADALCDFIKDANALRVLHLPKNSFHGVSIPQLLFPTLVHLRYVRLATGQRELHLPRAISRCYHLRILDLEACDGSLVLPSDMSNLSNLRHFLTKHDAVHSEISNVGKLQFLQELKFFSVNKESDGFELKQLGNLIELSELGIYSCEKIHTKEEATAAKLTEKDHLTKLTLGWDSARHNIEPDVDALVLENLRPSRNVRDLCIKGHGGPSCPSWLSSMLSVEALKSMCLDGVAWKDLPQLGHMWALQELKLKNISTIKELDTSHFGRITERSFCRLKKLKLISLAELEKCDACHLFSELEVLTIVDCPKLLGLPFEDSNCYPPTRDQEGKIHWFPKLLKFRISNCENVKSFPPVPWTRILQSVEIDYTGSVLFSRLEYSKSDYNVELKIYGKHDLHSLDEEVLNFDNLRDLQELRIEHCPLESKHLRMLTSLKVFMISDSRHVFVPSKNQGKVKWHLPVEHLMIYDCGASGQELTKLLSHLPKVSYLWICGCVGKNHMITHMGVEGDLQESWGLAEVEEEEEDGEVEEEEDDGGLLLLPAHYSYSLRIMEIWSYPQVRLVGPAFANDSSMAGRGGAAGRGLQALRCLQALDVADCPKFLSAYRNLPPSSFFIFPLSLQNLYLRNAGRMWTLEPLSNLTSLTELHLKFRCGEPLRSKGLWPLVIQGHLSRLSIYGSPKFFVGSDPNWRRFGRTPSKDSFKLEEVWTDAIEGFLTAPICTLFSSSLTQLVISDNKEVERFTEEQEEALQLLTSLQTLEFSDCPKLQCLPAGLCKLPKLKSLRISGCPAISSLLKDGLPNSLRELYVHAGGDEIKQQCRNFIRDHPEINLSFRFQDINVPSWSSKSCCPCGLVERSASSSGTSPGLWRAFGLLLLAFKMCFALFFGSSLGKRDLFLVGYFPISGLTDQNTLA
ncbi:hypothetical protein ACP70R_023486 [Stipagrostis hirtigluma subsp. patula]